MTAKEKFKALFDFEPIDRPLFNPTLGFWNETIERWRGEGMPGYVFNEHAAKLYFRFELMVRLPMLEGNLFPPFVPRVLKVKGNHRIVRDISGNIVREFTDGSSAIPQYLKSPVESMDDFRKIRWRLEADFPGRCANPLFDALYAHAGLNQQPLGTFVCGCFGLHRHLLGFENLMTAYYDAPDLLHAISCQWEKLIRGILRRLRRRYGIVFVFFWEDMCYKTGPMCSPKTFREFMTPYYKRVVADARDHGIEFLMVDTDGDCNLVIPLFKEVGVNMMLPFEVQAGMDILKVREAHPDLVIWGGLDKRALAKDSEAIEEEVFKKVPPLLKSGGYIPAIDHGVPPDVPLENFRFFMMLLKSRELARG